MDPVDFHDYVIKPTLDQLNLDQPGASFLLLGTALVESNLERVRQVGGGPALGVFQMEPATHASLWGDWLPRHQELARDLLHLTSDWPPRRHPDGSEPAIRDRHGPVPVPTAAGAAPRRVRHSCNGPLLEAVLEHVSARADP